MRGRCRRHELADPRPWCRQLHAHHRAERGDAGDGQPNQGEVEVCKYGTDARFNVVVGAGAPIQYSVANGTCKVVALDNSTNNTANSVTVTEVSDPSYTLVSVQKTVIQFQVNTTTDIVTGPTGNLPDGQASP